MDPDVRDFKSLPIEEQMVLAQSFRDGSIEDFESAKREFVSDVRTTLRRRFESSLREADNDQQLMALMRAYGR